MLYPDWGGRLHRHLFQGEVHLQRGFWSGATEFNDADGPKTVTAPPSSPSESDGKRFAAAADRQPSPGPVRGPTRGPRAGRLWAESSLGARRRAGAVGEVPKKKALQNFCKGRGADFPQALLQRLFEDLAAAAARARAALSQKRAEQQNGNLELCRFFKTKTPYKSFLVRQNKSPEGPVLGFRAQSLIPGLQGMLGEDGLQPVTGCGFWSSAPSGSLDRIAGRRRECSMDACYQLL